MKELLNKAIKEKLIGFAEKIGFKKIGTHNLYWELERQNEKLEAEKFTLMITDNLGVFIESSLSGKIFNGKILDPEDVKAIFRCLIY